MTGAGNVTTYLKVINFSHLSASIHHHHHHHHHRTNFIIMSSQPKTSCAGDRRNVPPPPLQVDLKPIDSEIGVLVTCNVGYLCANFSLPRPLCSRLRPDVRDRQTDRRQTKASLNAPAY